MVRLSNNTTSNVNLNTNNSDTLHFSANNDTDVNANMNGNSQRAKSWAVGEGLIDGVDYSAKHYAQIAREAEEEVLADTNDAHMWAEGTDEEVQALGGEHSSKGWVNYVLTNPPKASIEQTETGATITITDIDGTTTADITNGTDGQDGTDGVSPTASVTQTATGATITITDENGTTTADITNGIDGTDGTNGIDGFSPTATVTKSGDTATISITDANGTTTATVTDGTNGTNGQDGVGIASISKTSTSGLVDTYTITYTDSDTDTFTVTNGQNGTNGTNGQDGQDGFSPVANVTQTSSGATITITDSIGTTTANIINGTNGTNGTNGQDGYSPTATVTKSGTTATITITDKNGTTTANVYDGAGGVSDVQVDGVSVLSNGIANITGKQDTLVSGTNIKTINNTSLLGSGDIGLANNTLSNVSSIDSGSAVATELNGKADTDLSNLSSTGQAVIDAKVNKSGDTMTGALITQYSNTDEVGFYVSDTDITKGTTPSATEYMGVYFNDEKGNDTIAQARIGCIESAVKSDGSTELHLFTYQNVANSDTKAAFRLKMSAAGTGSCEFPQTNNCDGQWVKKDQLIASDVNFNTGGAQTKTYSLASYLPNDNYTYEVLFTIGGQTAATSGASFGFSLNSDLAVNVFVCRAIARSAAYVFAYGAATVPLTTKEIKVTQVNTTSSTPTMSTLRICAYRRVGTNA